MVVPFGTNHPPFLERGWYSQCTCILGVKLVPESSSFHIRKSFSFFLSTGFCSQSHSNGKIMLWIITLWTILLIKNLWKNFAKFLSRFLVGIGKGLRFDIANIYLFKFSSIFSDSLKWIASSCDVPSCQHSNCESDLPRSSSDNSASGGRIAWNFIDIHVDFPPHRIKSRNSEMYRQRVI